MRLARGVLSQTIASALKTGLVSFYEMDETSGTRYDAHGSNNLTDNNGVGYAAGKIGNAASFNDVKYFTPANNGVFAFTGAFSISVWLYNLIHEPNGRGIVNKYVTTGDNRSYSFNTTSGSPRFQVSGDGTFPVTDVTHTSKIRQENWDHLVAVFIPGTAMRVYLNNVKVENTTDIPAQVFDSTALCHIGTSHASGDWETWPGRMDLLGFWNRALSDSEVETLYNSGNALAYSAM